MLLLLIACCLLLAALLGTIFLLGFRLGGDHWRDELVETRLQAAQAERRLHDLTRQAFVAMTEHAEQRRQLP